MSASHISPAQLASFLKDLSLTDELPDHEQILKKANNVLNNHKANPLATHAKAVALLSLDRFDEALKLLESNDFPEALVEKAYALYKVGRIEDVASICNNVGSDASLRTTRALKHVDAQASYRADNFDRAKSIYVALAKEDPLVEGEDSDVIVNLGAADAQLALSGKPYLASKKKSDRSDLEAFERAYNAAALHIGRGEYQQASILLDAAERLCRELEERFSTEEIEAELEPVLAQKVYVNLKLGKTEQAHELSKSFDLSKFSDASIKLVATNNDLLSAPKVNPYPFKEALELVSSDPSLKLHSRLFDHQRRLFETNEAVLDLQVGKYNAANNHLTKYLEAHPNNAKAEAIRAIAAAENRTGKDLLQKLLLHFASRPDAGTALLIAQLRLETGDITGAINVLESVIEKTQSYVPGIVALLTTLYKSQGRKRHVAELLSKASDAELASSSPNPSLLRVAGTALLGSDEQSDLEKAGRIFSSLLESDPNDPVAKAGLVASFATIDPAKVLQYTKGLSPISSLISGINADALEAAGVAQPPSKKIAAKPKAASVKPRKPRRKRHLPKDYDPEKKVDPERWLPLKDRSYYKPKGKKAKKAFQAMQGGTVKEDDPAKADSPAPESKPKVSGGGQQNKKKKKKGGKW